MSDDITWDAPHGAADDITWDAPAAAPSTTMDVIKESAKGLGRGALSAAGDVGEAVMGPFGPSHHFANLMADLGMQARPQLEQTYGSQLAKAAGIEPSPQTTPGKFAGSISEAVGNPETYLGPGGLLSKGIAGAAAGAGGEAAGELAGGPLEPAARVLGAIGAGGLAGAAARSLASPRRIAPPSTQELFDQADTHYNQLHGYGVELHPRLPADTATSIETELRTAGYRPKAGHAGSKTFDIVDELRNPDNGQTMTTQEVEGIRRALGKLGFDQGEKDAARRAINEIDDMMATLQPSDVAINPHFAGEVSREAKLARANYAGAKRAEAIEGAKTKAELQAASTGSGSNIDNASRQQVKNILNSPRKLRGFSDAEKAQMEDIVRGTNSGNAARLLGKLAPSGIVSGALSAGLGHAVGHTIGVPALGMAAKLVSDLKTKSEINRLSNMVRLRTPLAARMGSTPLAPKVRTSGRAGVLLGQYGLPALAGANGEQ